MHIGLRNGVELTSNAGLATKKYHLFWSFENLGTSEETTHGDTSSSKSSIVGATVKSSWNV